MVPHTITSLVFGCLTSQENGVKISNLTLIHLNFNQIIQQISREQKTMAAIRLLRDNGLFRAFTPEEYHLEEFAIRRFIAFIDSVSTWRHKIKSLELPNDLNMRHSCEQEIQLPIKTRSFRFSLNFLMETAGTVGSRPQSKTGHQSDLELLHRRGITAAIRIRTYL